MKTQRRRQLGEILIAHGIITPNELAQALEAQKADGRRLGESLSRIGVSARHIAKALSEQLGLPLVHVSELVLAPEAMHALPESLAKRHQAIPIKITQSRITVALVDPLDAEAIDEISRVTRRRVDVMVTSWDDFDAAIRRYSAR
mgnify:CR=1 FL=1